MSGSRPSFKPSSGVATTSAAIVSPLPSASGTRWMPTRDRRHLADFLAEAIGEPPVRGRLGRGGAGDFHVADRREQPGPAAERIDGARVARLRQRAAVAARREIRRAAGPRRSTRRRSSAATPSAAASSRASSSTFASRSDRARRCDSIQIAGLVSSRKNSGGTYAKTASPRSWANPLPDAEKARRRRERPLAGARLQESLHEPRRRRHQVEVAVGDVVRPHFAAGRRDQRHVAIGDVDGRFRRRRRNFVERFLPLLDEVARQQRA